MPRDENAGSGRVIPDADGHPESAVEILTGGMTSATRRGQRTRGDSRALTDSTGVRLLQHNDHLTSVQSRPRGRAALLEPRAQPV